MDRAELERLRQDPQHWRGGLVYYCSRDPRLVVPMRVRGTGYSINFAQPRAGSTLLGIFFALVLPAALPLTFPSVEMVVAAVLLFAVNVVILTWLCHWESSRPS